MSAKTRSVTLPEVATLFVSWMTAVFALVTSCQLAGFISNQNGLARDKAPNCSALMHCDLCVFGKNVTAHLLGVQTSPQWDAFRRGMWHNIFVLVVFGAQHSLLATDWWKAKFSFMQPLVRSSYVAATVICLQYMVQTWVPVDLVLWCVNTDKNPSLWWLYTVVHSLFWVVLCGNLLVLDVSELCGVKQCHYRVSCGVDDPASLKSRDLQRLYRHLRHPGLVPGVVLLFVHPVMTYDRLTMGIALVVYFVSRSRIDEDDVEYGDRMMRWKKEETSPRKVRF